MKKISCDIFTVNTNKFIKEKIEFAKKNNEQTMKPA